MKKWHNSIYPEVSDRILVRWDSVTMEDAKKICDGIEQTAGETQWFLLAEDLTALEIMLPQKWLDGPTQKNPRGGIPPNVWLGAYVLTQEEVDERAPLLQRFRVRRRFLFVKEHHDDLDLTHRLVDWRCEHCGRRGYDIRPDACPTGNLCYGFDLLPQIHWVIEDGIPPEPSEPKELYSSIEDQCEIYGVKYWGQSKQEIPE